MKSLFTMVGNGRILFFFAMLGCAGEKIAATKCEGPAYFVSSDVIDNWAAVPKWKSIAIGMTRQGVLAVLDECEAVPRDKFLEQFEKKHARQRKIFCPIIRPSDRSLDANVWLVEAFIKEPRFEHTPEIARITFSGDKVKTIEIGGRYEIGRRPEVLRRLSF